MTTDREAELAKLDKEEPPQKVREWAEPIIFWAGVGISLFHIYFNTFGTIADLWTSALHFGMFGFLCALLYPMLPTRPGSKANWIVAGVDVLLGLVVLWTALHLILNEVALYDRGMKFLPLDWVAAIAAILLGIEFTRRTTGWLIPTLIVIAVTYVVWWGKYVSGVFQFPGLTLENTLFRTYFSGDGMFGPIARISSTYVFMFILFGAFLTRSGAGEFIMNLARCAAGKMTGGPGLVAVIGSAMMGTISGSAVANVAGTGVITIPLMKRAGFPPHFAASVESSASTGGQIMPPIMGAGAFVMASYTGIPYVHIIAASALPAILYFLSVGYGVRMQAIRSGIFGKTDPDAPTFGQTLRQGGHNLIPIAILVGLLVRGFTPTYAAGLSILAVIGTSWLSKNNKMGVMAICEALAKGARNMVPTAVLLVSIGLVVNVLGTTGIGNTFSLMIGRWAGGSLLITILWVSLAAIILGMGLPTTAAYIVLGTLSAPAIYNLMIHSEAVSLIASGQVTDTVKAVLMMVAPEKASVLGHPMPVATVTSMLAQVPPDMATTVIEKTVSAAHQTETLLSAHMIVFWLAQFSNLTPPVCLAVYAACAIAGSPVWKTGITAFKVGLGFFIIPFLFAYTPFLSSDWTLALKIFFFGVGGLYCFKAALNGYMETKIGWPMRIVLVFVGWVLIWPLHSIWEFAALAAFFVLLGYNIYQSRRNRPPLIPDMAATG